MIAQPPPGRWRRLAACRGKPTDWWFPEHPVTPTSLANLKLAQALCAECAVAIDCLVDACVVNEPYGWFGGAKVRTRTALRVATEHPVEWRLARPEVRHLSAAGTAA